MRRLFSTLVTAAILLGPTAAWPARVKGTVKRKVSDVRDDKLGYTVTQIASPAKRLSTLRRDVAIFLKVKTSLPLDPPTEHQTMTVKGLELVPDVATCAIDAQVTLVNAEPTPVTLIVGDDEFATLQPAERKPYPCKEITGGQSSESRAIRVQEWPHIRGSIFIGEIGLVAAPDESGRFEITAPKGQYLLQVVARDGVVDSREVDLGKGDVDVGTIPLGPDQEANEVAPEPPAPPPKKKRPPTPPPVELDDEDEGDDSE